MSNLTWAARLIRTPGPIALILAFSASAVLAGEQKQKAVIELFTSQGCPACPAADALLHEFSKRDDVIALSLSVPYWDYIGWKDTLATPENSQRQKNYARRKSSSENRIYTPQMIVNGMACVPAQVKDKIDAELTRTQDALKTSRVALSGSHAGPALIVDVGESGQHSPSSATLWLARVSPDVEVAIYRGENAGKKITYANAVRSLKEIGKWTGKPVEFEARFEATASDFYVAILQSDADGSILGAVDIR